MAQKSGLHRILEIPLIYNIVQKIFLHKETIMKWKTLIEENKKGVILDVGCGPGNQSEYFVDAQKYIGIDISKAYIAKARKLFGKLGEFHILSATDIDKLPNIRFDLVILNGVFHHLSDNEVEEFLGKIVNKLNYKGVLVSIDPTYVEEKTIGNLIISHDRGMHVRKSSEFLKISEKYLDTISCDIIKQKFPPYQRLLLKIGRR